MIRKISLLIAASLFVSSTALAGTITAKHSGKVVDVPGWNPLPGTQLIQWDANGGPNQMFDVNAESGGYYTIFSPMTRQCLDVSRESRENGATVIQWWCHKHDNQLWRVDRDSSGYVRFVNKNSGKCLTVSGGSHNAGAGLVQWECGNRDDQRFRY